MSDNPQHRAEVIRGPRHRANRADDPANIDLDLLFPGTAGKRAYTPPKHHGRNAALVAAAATGTIALIYTMTQARTTEQPGGTLQAAPVSDRGYSDPEQMEVVTGTVEVVAETPKVTTEAAPPPPPPKPAPTVPPAASPAPVAATAPAPAAPVVVPEQAAPPAPAPTVGGAATRAAIVAAALAQVGVGQDCTMLVTNSMVRAGMPYFHDWPAGYLSLGHTVGAAQALPGDLIYYANGGTGVAHIAVYIGNGNAVHGGWNGWGTVIFSANVGSGPVYIRVT